MKSFILPVKYRGRHECTDLLFISVICSTFLLFLWSKVLQVDLTGAIWSKMQDNILLARKQQLYLGPWFTKINSNVKNRMFWMRCKVHHSKILRVFGSYSVHSVACERSERVNVFWNCFIYPASGPTGPGFLHHRILWNTFLRSG